MDKKYKSAILILVCSIALIWIAFAAFKMYSNKSLPQQTEAPELIYSLAPSKTTLKVGETVMVPVYLKGKDAGRVSAYDIKFYYDVTKFKLTTVTPGNFFSKYITVKWDLAGSWFALAMTPANPKVFAQPDSPMLTLELKAIAKSAQTSVSTATSVVYVTKTGGFSPTTDSVNITIK